MRKTIAIAAASLALAPAAALAADNVPPAPMPVVVAPAPAPAGFPWAGAYWGVYGGFYTAPIGFAETGMQAGYNFVRGRLLTGVEIETNHIIPFGVVVDGFLNSRLGFLVNDRLLVYGQVGIGTVVWAPAVSAGGGVEFALRNSLSVFAEAKANFTFPGFAYFGTEMRAGINYHAGAAAAGGPVDPWSGLYFGTVGAMRMTAPIAEMGVQVGYNFHPGRLVIGVEAQTTVTVAPVINASLGTRAGIGIGDRTLLFVKTAIGETIAIPFISAGGGIERAFGDGTATAFVGAEAMFALVGPPTYFGMRFNAGINLHFGN